jgi:branched-subunit amino acid transport protein AzlD
MRHHHDYISLHRKQAIWFTAFGSVLAAAMMVGLIVYCYHSTHLQF